jgi:NAD(P)-dependent dehydrogenase (short-subunit alcohol dehydrogenase family)
MNDRKPEVVVITGASAGVGRATAQAFAQRGAHIGLLARSLDGLEGARADIEARGGRALIVETDVADPDQVEAAAQAVENAFGPIDIWINNAMVTVVSPVKLGTAEEVKRVTDVTYLGAVYGTMAALKRMLPRDRGVIVQVGSALAYRAIPLQAPYCGAKHALRGYTDALRCELLHDGSHVHVTMVHMPALNTPQFEWCKTRMPKSPQPVPPIFQPEVAARAIVWAAHQRRREVNVGLPTVKAVWANKFIPGFLDRYLAAQGYSGQMSDAPVDPERPINLWTSPPGDRGAHGRFDSEAKSRSLQLEVKMHAPRLAIGALVVAAALAAAAAFVRRRD